MDRYEKMKYRRCGASGVMLPGISMGLWHNFGEAAAYSNCREMITGSFDLGITHFDLANNYGPPPGAAELMFGRVLKAELSAHRDELFISSKAGFGMWKGPYGDWGSKKYLLSSLDQSLCRMGIDYVDLFYHHRPDPNTPIEETAEALEQALRSGKALYVGISNYNPQQTALMLDEFKRRGIKCLIHQMNYSMLRKPAEEVIAVLKDQGVGSIAFCPLAQGLLTNRYLNGVPEHSRAATKGSFLRAENITEEVVAKARALDGIAKERGQTLAQMALVWVLQKADSALIGASSLAQIEENVKSLDNMEFSEKELAAIDRALGD
jgi:L-glyceraldehyde 3-phosphate reductase